MPRYRTVAEAIARVGIDYPDNGMVFQDLQGVETRYSYTDLEADTARRAAALQDLGLEKGDVIGLVVIDPEEFILTFLAAVRVGVLPAPLYPPLSFGALDAYVEKSNKILTNAGAKVLIASSKLQNILWSLVDDVPSLEKLVLVEELDSDKTPDYPVIEPDDLCFLQYTSGSTSDPKGVMVTHGGLIINTHVICTEGLQIDGSRGDTAVSWLPLYHDMGLIGFVIAPVTMGLNAVHIPTLRFIKRPSVWLDTIHRHRGFASFAPNFAYALTMRRVKKSQLEKWDLSCLKVLGCGAEPIQPETMRQFVETFKPCGLPDTTIMAAYGMAEATLAIGLTPGAEMFQTRWVDAESFQEDGVVAEPIEGKQALEHVACGTPFSGHECVAMDENDNILPEGREGELCLRGPSNTPGYYRNPEATAKTFRNGWLHTGDLGYIQDGQIYITGRLKDLIILNGRNIHPQAVEWCASEVNGVRKGNVIGFSVPGPTSEQVILCVETRFKDERREALRKEVIAHIQKQMSLALSDVVMLTPGTLPKTSSGKLQRRKCRKLYLTGKVGAEGNRLAGASGSTLTVARHVAKSMWTRAKAAIRS